MNLFHHLASFQGRIGRAHYWLLILAAAALVFLAATVGSLNLENEPVQWFAYALLLASCVPAASATFRRLHDIDFSSFQIVVFLVATGLLQILAFLLSKMSPTLGVIVTVVMVAAFVALGAVRGTTGPNRYDG